MIDQQELLHTYKTKIKQQPLQAKAETTLNSLLIENYQAWTSHRTRVEPP